MENSQNIKTTADQASKKVESSLEQASKNVRSEKGFPKRTFVYPISDCDVNIDKIQARLGENWVHVPIKPGRVDLVLATGGDLGNKKLYTVSSTLKFRAQSEQICDKGLLHQNLAKFAPDTIAKTFYVDSRSRIRKGEVWILRGVWGWGGKASCVVTNTQELTKGYQMLLKKARDGHFKRADVIASRYIDPPLLHEGYKFHVRFSALVTVLKSGERFLYFLKKGVLIPADEEYKSGDWDNLKIHDTHSPESSERNLVFPASPEHFSLIDPTVEMVKRSFIPLIHTVTPYEESDNAYELWGIDVMYTSDGTPVIIEVNGGPGMGYFKDRKVQSRYEDQILDMIWIGAISKCFEDLPTTPTNENVIQLYSSTISAVPDQYPVTSKQTFIYPRECQIPVEYVKARLDDGWVQIPENSTRADLVLATGNGLFDKKLFNVLSTLKCRISCSDIVDKGVFHQHMMQIAPELIAETFYVNNRSRIRDGEVWILRGVWGWGGKASRVVSDNQEFKESYQMLMKQTANVSRNKKHVIASRYIDPPMLYEGFKFHVRINLVLTILESGERFLYLLNNGILIPAHKPYKSGFWSNEEIHDTHGTGNALRNRPFPETFEQESLMIRSTDAITRSLIPLIDTVSSYEESNNGFELLGADVMFTSNGDPIVIEINSVPGIVYFKDPSMQNSYASDVLDLIWIGAICKCFELVEVPKNDKVVQLYP